MLLVAHSVCAERIRNVQDFLEVPICIENVSSFERLQIYNRQYWYRLTDCLYDDYPGMRAIIGNKRFYLFSCAYLIKFPSRNFSLSELGQNLVQFTEENPEWGGRRQRAFVEMARFEWAQVVAFDREFLPALNLTSLAGKNPDQLLFRLQPYLTLLELNYPFDEFVIALKKNESNHSESIAQRDVNKIQSDGMFSLPKKNKVWLAVHRLNNQLYYKRLEEPAFILLSELKAGRNLAEACNVLVTNYTNKKALDLNQSIQNWFKEWGMLGWFVDPNASNSYN
jgi:hypothetical protein